MGFGDVDPMSTSDLKMRIMKTIHHSGYQRTTTAAATALVASLPTLAMAHSGHHGEGGAISSLGAGFLHPLSGMDHMILALAMGWLAFSLGAHRARVPAITFLAALAVGAVCGRWISGGMGLEIAISLTVLAAGGVMLRDRLRGLGMLSIVAVAGGAIHGLAHGAEALPGVSFATYAIGLLISTALLLGTGAILQHAFSKTAHSLAAVRVAGVVTLIAGAAFLIRVF